MIKVFEAFAGYGSQRMALRNLKILHEVVGISEIDGSAILSYAAIHTDLLKQREINQKIYTEETTEEMYEYLEKINAPLCYKTFVNKSRKLKKDKLNDMYLANKLSKNFGDITQINPEELPDFDLFTYSFPCQDISVAGFQESLSAGSGTRSSLLWECCKIIETKKPKYLMMENVKNLVGKNHKAHFEEFLMYLEKQGYINKWAILNAKDYGAPQRRERVFCISVLNIDSKFEFPEAIPLEKNMKDLLEKDVPNSFYLNNNQFADEEILPKISYCLDANYWKGTTLKQYLSKARRQLVSGEKMENGKYPVRRLIPLETWRLMGCTDEDFDKASQVNSNTNLYKQAGNSIVVSVLEAIFRNLFINQKQDLVVKKEDPLVQKIISAKTKLEAEKILAEIKKNVELKKRQKSHSNEVYQAKLFGEPLKNSENSMFLETKIENKNNWIFQYTTTVYPDVINDLDSGKLKRWEVNKHIGKIKKNDKALIYIGGKKGKLIYGLAAITSDLYFVEEKGKYYCDIKIIKYLKEKELSYRKVKENLPKIKIGITGTNFSLSEQELNTVLNL